MSAERTGKRRPGFGIKRRLREILINASIVVVTLAIGEIALRFIDLRELRDGYGAGHAAMFSYDAELGWAPIPQSVGRFNGSRDFTVKHNRLGLRDLEHEAKPGQQTVLFIGDSFVWGYDADAQDRFTERLRESLPNVNIVNAGVPGFGTDQEYLLLRRIWDQVRPDIVVLVYCADNDRENNSSNLSSPGNYKPFFQLAGDGTSQLLGQPAPQSRHVYFKTSLLARNSWLVRAAVTGYVHLRYAKIEVPDPTEHLVAKMQELVESRGAKFIVGMQEHDAQLEAFLRGKRIPFEVFAGAERFAADGSHWTPKGHAVVATQLRSLFKATGMLVGPSETVATTEPPPN